MEEQPLYVPLAERRRRKKEQKSQRNSGAGRSSGVVEAPKEQSGGGPKRARTQASRKISTAPVLAEGNYNIWYHKKSGSSRREPKVRAETRCDPERDSGVTVAESTALCFCLHFARGCCCKGYDCSYLHGPSASLRVC